MTRPTLASKLNEMSQAAEGRSLAARLRDVFPDIEKALRAGVSRKAVLRLLQEDGMQLEMKTFESALYRMRKSNAAQSQKLTPPAAVQPAAKATETVGSGTSTQPVPIKSDKHPFAGLGGNGRDKDAVHYSVPDKDRIYGRKKEEPGSAT